MRSARNLTLSVTAAIVAFCCTAPARAQQCGEQVLGGAADSFFGSQIATDGTTLLVRRSLQDWPSALRRMDLMERVAGQWVRQSTWHSAPDTWVAGLAVADDVFAIAEDGASQSLRLYVKGPSGWAHAATLSLGSSQVATQYGAPLVLHGDRVAGGASAAKGQNGIASGALYSYRRVGGTSWQADDPLFPPDGAVGDRFGGAADLFGDALVVGASHHDQPLPDAGAVYCYERDSSGWQLKQKLVGTDNAAHFGSAVALDGDWLAVASPGIARVSLWSRTGTALQWVMDLGPPETVPHLNFGASLCLDGDWLAVGAPSANAALPGATYLFARVSTGWESRGKLLSPAASAGHGKQLALDQATLFVGAGNSSSAAAARLFAYDLDAAWGSAAQLPAVGVDLGGTQLLRLATCPPLAGGAFWVLGSASGTQPGLALAPGLTLALVPDAYFFWTANQASPAPISGGVGTFAADGVATPSIVIPKATAPALAGLELHHALVGFSPNGVFAGFGLPVSLRLLPRKSIWTVGPHSDADFAEIHAAIADSSVAANDTLLVSPGYYQSFDLTKPLNILGPSGDKFQVDDATITHIPRFTLTNMRAARLRVQGVSERASLHDVSVFEMAPAGVYRSYTTFEDCAELIVSQSVFHGSDTCQPGAGSTASPGVELIRSKATFIDSAFYGGWVLQDDVLCKWLPPNSAGQPGLLVREGSDVTLAACRVQGGYSMGLPDTHGDGLKVVESYVRVMGSSAHTIEAIGSSLPISTSLGSFVRASGVTLHPFTLSPGVLWLDEPEPFLRVSGPSTLGGVREVQLHGPADAWFWLVVSGTPAHLPQYFPGLDPLWLDPLGATLVIALKTAGQETPVSAALAQPTPWPGTSLWIQAWMRTGGSGAGSVTNVAQWQHHPGW